ncbi:MAG: hypothetical protein KDA22_15085, partial [Phycisphaerales bacterium]|nr:hypothetical protein [Phycisphaerales bacterium]
HPLAARRAPAAPPADPGHPRRPVAPTPVAAAPSGLAPRPPIGLHQLTAFDRLVLAVLVGSGGWNATSRARLVVLAARHNVSVEGLLMVVSGLVRHVRSGVRRPDAHELASSASRLMAERTTPTPGRVGQALERVQDVVAEELRAEGVWPRVRLSVLFGAIVLLLGTLFVRMLLLPPSLPGPPRPSAPLAPERSSSARVPGLPIESPAGPARPVMLIAKFPSPPTFRGQPRPAEALNALERSGGIAAEIEHAGRRLVVDRGRVSEAALRQWRAAIDDASACWPLMERIRLDQVLNAIAEALRGVDSTSASQVLLAALDPNVPQSDPLWIWKGSFRAGVLGEIVRRAAIIPPEAVQIASTMLAAASGPDAVLGGVGFGEQVGAWLDRAASEMVLQCGGHGRFEDDWEAWIAAQREVRRGGELQLAYAQVAERLLREQPDLSRPGQGSELLGRLLELLDLERSAAVRTAVSNWFLDDSINANNLWVVTSLLASYRSVSWFDAGFILPWDADQTTRGQVRDAMLAAWPMTTEEREEARPIVEVERSQLERWLQALDALEAAAAAPQTEREAMRFLLLASEVNEAAECFLEGQFGSGYDLASGVVESLSAGGDDLRRSVAIEPGTPSVASGSWANAYAGAGRDSDARMTLLRQLRLQPGGDLWPADAEVLVREVVRGSPADLRSVARGVLVERYANGPMVVLELLDQLVDASPTEELAQVVAKVTGAALPSIRSENWRRAARAALAQRALELQSNRSDGAAIDDMSRLLASGLRRRLVLAGGGLHEPGEIDTPTGAVGALVDAWRESDLALVVRDPVPAPISDIDRRRAVRSRLAEGVIAAFVGEQVTLQELIAYAITAQQPWSREAVRAVLADVARQREKASHVLGQALRTELATARLWRLALTAEVADPGMESGSVRPGEPGAEPVPPAPSGAETPEVPETEGPRRTPTRRLSEPIQPPSPGPPQPINPKRRP